MGKLRNIVTPLHKKTARDYVARMVGDKIHCMEVAKQYGFDYWDGDRKYGYGGYRYDGRWEVVARGLIEAYGLQDGAKILDVGCGKAFLLYELKRLLPNAEIAGFDSSEYALENAKDEVRDRLFLHRAEDAFPYEDEHFDLVISLGTLHNLPIFGLKSALREMERVAKQGYLMVEGYRSDAELFNLQCWALTAEAFYDTAAWIWLYNHFGYTGDYEFIYFE